MLSVVGIRNYVTSGYNFVGEVIISTGNKLQVGKTKTAVDTHKRKMERSLFQVSLSFLGYCSILGTPVSRISLLFIGSEEIARESRDFNLCKVRCN